MKNKNTVIAIVVVLLIAAGGWYYVSSGKFPLPAGTNAPAGAGDTVAVVNGENILRSDLDATEAQITAQAGVTATTSDAQAQLQTQALDSLVGKALLRQAAEQSGITASSTEVDAQVQSTKGQFESQDAYEQALSAQNMTEDDLRAEIGESLAINAYLDQELHLSSITATDEEIQATYDQVADGQTDVPALADVRDQVEQLVIQQKQQTLIDAQVQKLRSAGNVQILI